MKVATVHLKSVSTYSQSKVHQTPKLKGELDKDYEARTWRERLWYNEDDYIYIPPMQQSAAIKAGAKYSGEQIPGKGKATYTKHFEAGVMVVDPIVLPIKKDDCPFEWVHVPSDGKKGGGRRVWKCFGIIPEWEGDATFYIMDDIITKDVFEKMLYISGALIGYGRWRPINGGIYGRFKQIGETKWATQ